jgi:hypothetical protein
MPHFYSIAESISAGCVTVLVVTEQDDADRIISLLPLNLTIKENARMTDCSVPASSSASSLSPSDDSQESPDLSELKIAWQYGKYLKDETNPVVGNSFNQGTIVFNFKIWNDIAYRVHRKQIDDNDEGRTSRGEVKVLLFIRFIWQIECGSFASLSTCYSIP